jgi:DNA-binding NarL/FixJ family response regulator
MEKAAKIKVVIADDNKLFREGLKAIFDAGQDVEVIGEAKDGFEAIRSIKVKKPDLLLLDISMPRLNGISVILDIRREFKDLKILALTMHDDGSYIHEAFEAGINGYCVKDASLDELLLAVHSLMNDRVFISPQIGEDIVHKYVKHQMDSESKRLAEEIVAKSSDIDL